MKQIKKTITKAEIAAMPKVLFPGRIFVIYTESEAEKAVAYLKDQRIVGVDTETRPSFKRGTTHKVALLQISTQDTCFLFRLNRIGMPDSLQEFLMSDTLKIGLSLKDDFNSCLLYTSPFSPYKPTALCSNSTLMLGWFITRACIILDARKNGLRTIR